MNIKRTLAKLATTLKKGFTLIELLVVVAIIGILVAYATANYITAQKQARDTRRMEDMKAIQTAFETYFSINQVYPTAASDINASFDTGTAPKDPQSTKSYTWKNDSTSYCICTPTLETKTGNANGYSAGSPFTCSWTATGNIFCVQNKQ